MVKLEKFLFRGSFSTWKVWLPTYNFGIYAIPFKFLDTSMTSLAHFSVGPGTYLVLLSVNYFISHVSGNVKVQIWFLGCNLAILLVKTE